MIIHPNFHWFAACHCLVVIRSPSENLTMKMKLRHPWEPGKRIPRHLTWEHGNSHHRRALGRHFFRNMSWKEPKHITPHVNKPYSTFKDIQRTVLSLMTILNITTIFPAHPWSKPSKLKPNPYSLQKSYSCTQKTFYLNPNLHILHICTYISTTFYF